MRLDPKRQEKLLLEARYQFIEDLKPKVAAIQNQVQNTSLNSTEGLHLELFRFYHSIHGTSSTLGFQNLARKSKAMEERLQEVLKADQGLDETLIREIKEGLISLQCELVQFTASKLQSGALNSSKEYTNLPNNGTVLLVDDDLVILKLLEASLVAEGYTVYISDDSLAVMDIVAVAKPDLILLDIMMPQCDGYEILERIKTNPEYANICVIFLSGLDNVEDKIKGMKAGVDDYITKPFDVRELITRVEMVLRRGNKFKEKLLKDALTDAYSRSYLYERLKDEFERFKRNRVNFSLAFIDIDYFKRVNDTFGHSTGDYVLTQFTAFMIENLRESDCIFRYGGEEFIILLPDATEKQAFMALERLREDFSHQEMSYEGKTFFVSFSCGVKEVNEGDKSITQLISRCDEAMYMAKNTGRNKVIPYSNLQEQMSYKKKILVVDDENTILKLVSDRLTEAGYKIIVAENGEKALDLVANEYFDGVVLDLILPDIEGLEVCKKIKACSLSRDIRVIILSKKSEEEDIVNGLNSGADDYVTKPFSMVELEARIMRVLCR